MSKLLILLASQATFSQEELCTLLECTSEHLSEEIYLLQQQGIQIACNQQGIQLIPQLQLLDYSQLSQQLAPYKVVIQPVIDSTNQYLLDNLDQLNKGDLCLAEHQTAGRGRRGRQWLSPFAGQVILSLYWTFEPKKSVEGLSLVIGMAIIDTLKQVGAYGVSLKWPNDVLLNGRKLAGILIEMAKSENKQLNLVIGIGINLSMPQQDNRINQPWAELIEVLPDVDRNQLIIRLVKNIYAYLDEFEQQGISAEFRQKWLEVDDYFGEEVNVITEKQIISGIEQGIDEKGYLQIIANNGTEWLKFNGGEVSLRKK